MSACCVIPFDSKVNKGNTLCPNCGKEGKAVPLITIRAQVRRDHHRYSQLTTGYYCTSAEDDLVYYFADSDTTIWKTDLVEPGPVKGKGDDTMICFCFRHRRQEILDDYRKNGKSVIEIQIRKKVKAGACSCEVSNPAGKCCLGNVRSVYQNGGNHVR